MILKYLRLIRWPNLLIMAISMVLVRYYLIIPQIQLTAEKSATSTIVFICLVLSVLLIAAGGFVINDIFDTDVDSVNKPEKQLVGKFISKTNANKLYLILTLGGIILGFYVGLAINNWRISVIFIAMAGLMWFYSKRYKRMQLIGNIVVSFATAMVLLIVWVVEFFALIESSVFSNVVIVFPQITGLVMAYTLFAFLTSLIRELIKDIEDTKGDALAGCRTFPVVSGETNAKNLAIGLIAILLVMIGFWQYILFFQSYYYAFSFLFLADIIGVLILLRVAMAKIKKHYKQTSLLLKVLMISGLLSILFI